MEATGRCMRCKDTRVMNVEQIDKTKRGGFIAKGKCATCGCNMARILSKDGASKLASSLGIQLPE